MVRQFLQVVTELNDFKFRRLSEVKNLSDKYQILYDNLWSMFNIPSDSKQRQVGVSDFAWTESVRTAFYEHPYHKKFIQNKKNWPGMSTFLFTVNSEPADLKDSDEYEIVTECRHERHLKELANEKKKEIINEPTTP